MADELTESLRDRDKRFERELIELNEALESLRMKYDRYFMGLERIPPEKDRANLTKALRNANVRNSHRTAHKFQLGNIRNRLTSYARHWDRTMRLIEEGKFRREKSNSSGLSRSPGARGEKGPGKDAAMRTLYDDWLAARRQTVGSTNVDFGRSKTRVERQRSSHKEKFGSEGIEYRVRIKGGKVALVAKAKGEKSD